MSMSCRMNFALSLPKPTSPSALHCSAKPSARKSARLFAKSAPPGTNGDSPRSSATGRRARAVVDAQQLLTALVVVRARGAHVEAALLRDQAADVVADRGLDAFT